MEKHIAEWAREKVTIKRACYDWEKLPRSFEAEAVQRLYSDIRKHFARDDIKQRIAASKAITFDELLEAIPCKSKMEF